MSADYTPLDEGEWMCLNCQTPLDLSEHDADLTARLRCSNARCSLGFAHDGPCWDSSAGPNGGSAASSPVASETDNRFRLVVGQELNDKAEAIRDLTARLAAAEATIAAAVSLLRSPWSVVDVAEARDLLSAYRPVAAHPEVESND